MVQIKKSRTIDEIIVELKHLQAEDQRITQRLAEIMQEVLDAAVHPKGEEQKNLN